MTIAITAHAIDEFLRLVRPDLDREAARVELARQADATEKLPERTLRGQALYAIEDGAALVVKTCDGTRQLVAVTVLGAHEVTRRGVDRGLLDAMERAAWDGEGSR